MRKIGFIGSFDKTDLIMYTAKILDNLGYKVLMVDSTILQKTRFIVPSINPTRTYITSFENIDFAIGFKTIEELEESLGYKIENQNGEYDYILFDIDGIQTFNSFDILNSYKNYFVTSFDLYSLNKGIKIFQGLENKAKLTKILFSYENTTKDEEEYLDTISLEYDVEWSEYVLYFPITAEDNKVFQENQRLEKIRCKRLSNDYRESLACLFEDFDKEDNTIKVRKIIRE